MIRYALPYIHNYTPKYAVVVPACPIRGSSAPSPVTNGEFMYELRKNQGIPFGIPAPEFGLKLVGKLGGPDASLMLTSQKVLPERLLREGFSFEFSDLSAALNDLRN